MESDIPLGISILYFTDRFKFFFPYVLSNLPWKRRCVAVSVRQTCSQLLCSLACITDGENMPLMKSHNKKASPEVLDPRETKQEATCLPTVPTVLWPALCSKRDLSKWLFQQYCWNDVMSHCSWKRTISILFLPIPHEPTHSGTCMSMFWVNFLCQTEGKLIQHQQQKQQKPTLFFCWLLLYKIFWAAAFHNFRVFSCSCSMTYMFSTHPELCQAVMIWSVSYAIASIWLRFLSVCFSCILLFMALSWLCIWEQWKNGLTLLKDNASACISLWAKA